MRQRRPSEKANKHEDARSFLRAAAERPTLRAAAERPTLLREDIEVSFRV